MSLTVGPGGPLVRFDYSPFPLHPLAEQRRGLRRSSPALGGPCEPPRVGMDPQDWGGSSGGRGSDGDGGSHRRRASRRPAASGVKWFWGCGGSRSKSSRGKGSREEEKALGGESGEGEVLVVPGWPGWWRLQELSETGKKTSPGRLRASEAP